MFEHICRLVLSVICLRRRGARPAWWLQNVPELSVEEISMAKERGLQMRMKHPVFAKLADDIACIFAESGAINYVEFTICSEKYGPLSVVVQRIAGETPAQQNERLRKHIEELEMQLAGTGE